MLTQLICNPPGLPPSELVSVLLADDATVTVAPRELDDTITEVKFVQEGGYQLIVSLSAANLARLKAALADGP